MILFETIGIGAMVALIILGAFWLGQNLTIKTPDTEKK